ncbi:hypothetical protein ACFLZG_01025 [Thermodesulfobacteriota bacterium]
MACLDYGLANLLKAISILYIAGGLILKGLREDFPKDNRTFCLRFGA